MLVNNVRLLSIRDSLSGYTGGYGGLSDSGVYSLQTALSTVSSYSSPFAVQMLFDGTKSPNSPYDQDFQSHYIQAGYYIFTDGCPGTAPTANCTELCASDDPKVIFSSLYTLHNCFTLPNITTTASQNVSWMDAFGNAPASPDLADSLFYQPGVNVTAAKFAKTITSCLEDYCDNLGDACSEAVARTVAVYDLDRTQLYGTSQYGHVLVTNICNSVDQHVLSDIGGIGVYISYFLQSGISLLAFVFSLSWMVLTPYMYIIWERKQYKQKPEREIVRSAVRRSRRHLAIMTVSIIDFQKVQCFFMLATDIAALIVVRRAGLQPNSLQQLYNTYFFLKLIAISGILPITFTLLNLYLLDILSTYILFLSTTSVLLSIGMYSTVSDITISHTDRRYVESLFNSGGPDSCGNRQIGVFCYKDNLSYASGSDSSSDSGQIAGSLLPFAFTVLVLLATIKLATSLRGPLKRWGKTIWMKTQRSRQYTRLFANKGWQHSRPRLRLALCYIISGSRSLGELPLTRKVLSKSQACAQRINEHPRMRALESWDARHMSLVKRHLPRARQVNERSNRSADTVLARLGLTTFHRLTCLIYHYHTGHPFPSRWNRILFTTFRWLIGFIIFAIYVTFFKIFLQYLTYYAIEGIYNNTWNFGQVVSLSVWVPPIAEFIYLEIRGIRKGSQYRLQAKDYIVVRAPYDLRHTPTDLERAQRGRSVDSGSDRLGHKEMDMGTEMDMTAPLTHNSEACEIVDEKHMQPTVTQVRPGRNSSISSDLLRSATYDDWGDIGLKTDPHDASDTWWRLPEPDLSSRDITLSTHTDDT